jgi:predicted TIM-barrel fold metal-dependent hydrolase
MKRRSLAKVTLVSVLAIACLAAGGIKFPPRLSASPLAEGESGAEWGADLKPLAALDPIDAHVHAWVDSPVLYTTLEHLRMHVVDICVVSRYDEPIYKTLAPQIRLAITLHHHSRGRVAVCTTFDPYRFEVPHFADEAIEQLHENFRQGAVAVKIYKNMGMELKWSSGKYLMPDDPVFEPIYKEIAAQNKTVIAHLADPNTCWTSYEEMDPNGPDYKYLKMYPFWHMYGKPGAPSKAQILAARDHILEENPHLRLIGAHLGSMETDVDEIARRFDRLPNFAVDTADRVHYLAAQSREKVRAFIIKYQDRILYGTDDDLHPGMDAAKRLQEWQSQFALDWKYFATDETFRYAGATVQGLHLPPEVLKKVYHENAVRWIPGVLASPSTTNH